MLPPLNCYCIRFRLPQLVAYEVTQLSPTAFEQRVVPHSISGLGGQRKRSWIRWGWGPEWALGWESSLEEPALARWLLIPVVTCPTADVGCTG